MRTLKTLEAGDVQFLNKFKMLTKIDGITRVEGFDNIKAVFFRFEEGGCIGSNKAEMDFFKDSNFILQCDRKGNDDFVTKINSTKLASEEFESAIADTIKKYNYKKESGLTTDVWALKKKGVSCSCANMSCGYYSPHSDRESISIKDVDNCQNMVWSIFTQFGDTRFEHKYEPIEYIPYGTYGQRSRFSYRSEKNFFTKEIQFEIEELETEPESEIFTEYQEKGVYKLTRNCDLYIENFGKGKYSESPIDVLFCSLGGYFENFSLRIPETITDEPEIYQIAEIEDKEIDYVYDRYTNCWYKKEDARWDTIQKTYRRVKDLVF